MAKTMVSLVIPIHNEAPRVWGNTVRLRERLRSLAEDFEIILVENGSVDDTHGIAEALAERYREVKLLTLPEAGLGEALKLGFKKALGEKIVYFPMDLSVEPEFITQSLRLLEEYDIVVGSKRLGSGLDGRPLSRRLASMAFHGLVRGLSGTFLSDTTCAKAYRGSRVRGLLDLVPSGSRVFETELLLEAEKKGLRIKEVPVRVVERRRSRQPLGAKVMSKLEDLLSSKLDVLAIAIGVPVFASGIIWLIILAASKLVSSQAGFINPYSFLASMLLVISGFQIVFFGLLANLILQMRREMGRSARSDEAEKPPVGDADEEDDDY
jgi:glycosyltransferase involved in cell wall biosynthesis